MIPTNLDDFEDFKEVKDLIVRESDIERDEYKFNLIREKWVVSRKYNQKVLDFYYDTLENDWKEKGAVIKAYFTDWTIKQISYTKEIIEEKLNNFRWYLCYPFSIPTNILLNFDLLMLSVS